MRHRFSCVPVYDDEGRLVQTPHRMKAPLRITGNRGCDRRRRGGGADTYRIAR
ncbi:hypothetical protein M8494_03940 [Serratia ureilytica]